MIFGHVGASERDLHTTVTSITLSCYGELWATVAFLHKFYCCLLFDVNVETKSHSKCVQKYIKQKAERH